MSRAVNAPCRFYPNCTNAACVFWHPTTDQEKAQFLAALQQYNPSYGQPQAAAPPGKTPCRFGTKCTRGKDCLFYHPPSAPATVAPQQPQFQIPQAPRPLAASPPRQAPQGAPAGRQQQINKAAEMIARIQAQQQQAKPVAAKQAELNQAGGAPAHQISHGQAQAVGHAPTLQPAQQPGGPAQPQAPAVANFNSAQKKEEMTRMTSEGRTVIMSDQVNFNAQQESLRKSKQGKNKAPPGQAEADLERQAKIAEHEASKRKIEEEKREMELTLQKQKEAAAEVARLRAAEASRQREEQANLQLQKLKREQALANAQKEQQAKAAQEQAQARRQAEAEKVQAAQQVALQEKMKLEAQQERPVQPLNPMVEQLDERQQAELEAKKVMEAIKNQTIKKETKAAEPLQKGQTEQSPQKENKKRVLQTRTSGDDQNQNLQDDGDKIVKKQKVEHVEPLREGSSDVRWSQSQHTQRESSTVNQQTTRETTVSGLRVENEVQDQKMTQNIEAAPKTDIELIEVKPPVFQGGRLSLINPGEQKVRTAAPQVAPLPADSKAGQFITNLRSAIMLENKQNLVEFNQNLKPSKTLNEVIKQLEDQKAAEFAQSLQKPDVEMKASSAIVPVAPTQVPAADVTMISSSLQQVPEIKPSNIEKVENVNSQIPQQPEVLATQQVATPIQEAAKPQPAIVALASGAGQSELPKVQAVAAVIQPNQAPPQTSQVPESKVSPIIAGGQEKQADAAPVEAKTAPSALAQVGSAIPTSAVAQPQIIAAPQVGAPAQALAPGQQQQQQPIAPAPTTPAATTAPTTTVTTSPQAPTTAQAAAPSQPPPSALPSAPKQPTQPPAPQRAKVTWETVQQELADFTALLTSIEAKLPLPIKEAHTKSHDLYFNTYNPELDKAIGFPKRVQNLHTFFTVEYNERQEEAKQIGQGLRNYVEQVVE